MIFAIDGRELRELPIINYSISIETLEGEGTGETKAYGWPMIRDVRGQKLHLSLTFAASNSNNPDFVYLWQTIRSMGSREYALIKFVDPVGETIDQDMTLVASRLRYAYIRLDGKVYTNALSVEFKAQRGV